MVATSSGSALSIADAGDVNVKIHPNDKRLPDGRTVGDLLRDPPLPETPPAGVKRPRKKG